MCFLGEEKSVWGVRFVVVSVDRHRVAFIVLDCFAAIRCVV